MVLLIAAGLIILDRLSRDKTIRIFLIILMLVINGYHIYRFTECYALAHREFQERMQILEAAPSGSVARIKVYTQFRRSKWFYGDDNNSNSKLRVMARYFGLERIDPVLMTYFPVL